MADERVRERMVGVLGCGLMGAGIVEVALRYGYSTVVCEPTGDLLDRGTARLRRSMARGVEKGKLTAADRDAALARLTPTTALDELGACDILIEAITEDASAKAAAWARVARVAKAGCLRATNTSSIPLARLAPHSGDPSRFIGLHFMNPVPVMALVEVVRGRESSDQAVAEGRAFAESLGKTTILATDTPGFVVNALLVPYLCDAVRMLDAGVATAGDIDTGMQLGCSMPMGPVALLDLIGLDTTLAIAEVLHEEFGESRYAPPPLLRRMVENGRLGRKSGRGFYDYET